MPPAVSVDQVARAWVLPDEPVPVRLMNTVWADRASSHDDLVAPEDLAAWLHAVDLLVLGRKGRERTPTRESLRLARRTRDALRRLAAAVTADDRARAPSPLGDDEAARALNDALLAVPAPRLWRLDDKWRLTRPGPHTVEQALASVVATGVELLTAADQPLRACKAPGCVLYFVKDHPRREWCSTGCGNRVRAARHYARHRPSAP